MSSEEVSLETLEETKGVEEVLRLVEEVVVNIEDCPKQLRIRAYLRTERNHSGSDAKYMAVPNYQIWGPTQGDPYMKIAFASTPLNAIKRTLDGFLKFWDPEGIDKIKLVRYENF